MKVLYLHQHFSTPAGPAGTRSYEFSKKLIEQGHQVTMVCGSSKMACTGLSGEFFGGKRRGIVEGIQIIEFAIPYSNYDGFFKRSTKFLKFAFQNIKTIFQEEYDVLYATSTPLTVAIPGIIMKIFKPKIPFIFEVRDLWPELPKAMGVIKNKMVLGMMSVLERLAYYYADAGVGLAPGICLGMQKHGSLKECDITFIPNGCDLSLLNTVPNQPPVVLPSDLIQLLETKFTAIFIGAHGVANGLGAALDAAKVLQDLNEQQIQLIFIGDGKLKPHLMARAQKEQLENCHFFKAIPKEALPWVLNKAKVGLMLLQNVEAFYRGTSPNKFFDYIAAGLPVLINYPGWIADLVQEYHCGVAVQPEQARLFAAALIKLSKTSPEELLTIKKNAQRLALKKFNREDLANQFLRLCEKMTCSRHEVSKN